eukprot:COSAG06_NODE_1260_length_10074_cov_127.640000_7_plen_86_part_00
MSLPDCYPDERMDRIYCVAPIVSGVGQEQVQYFVTAPVFTGAQSAPIHDTSCTYAWRSMYAEHFDMQEDDLIDKIINDELKLCWR